LNEPYEAVADVKQNSNLDLEANSQTFR
jgi:hypothetical protein